MKFKKRIKKIVLPIKKTMQKTFRKIKKIFYKYKQIILMSLPFIVIDIATRLFGTKINFFPIYSLIPNLFTIIWISLFIGLCISSKKKTGRILYIIFLSISFIFFLINNVYYSITDTFFDFSLLEMTSEGSGYFKDALINCNKIVYLVGIVIVLLGILGYKNIKVRNTTNYKLILRIIITVIISHTIIPFLYGNANSDLTWNTWRNPRNVYISFNDNNKSMRISGLYEYTIRNFYITYIKPKKADNVEEIEFLNEAYINNNEKYNTQYTNYFEGKNIIFLQLEGIDEWILNETTTPTLYNMQNNAFNFTNHYSYYNGGGSTFNSEFAVNTGFFTPLSYTQNAYSFNRNNFDYSLANLFKDKEYTVNAFHMNSKEYYSRGTNYDNWGYDNYYSLKDLGTYTNEDYTLDRELILNEEFNKLLFPNDSLFVDYIITYSNHLPFASSKGVCSLILDKEKEQQNENESIESPNNDDEQKEEIILTEEECIKKQAGETDYMVSLLLNELTERNLIDNTIIVVFTDHYLYTLTDQTILDKYKTTSNNLINNTPFFIWSNNMKKTNIKEVTSQLNILPTVLNLMGMEYNPTYYVGEDALNPNYKGYVFFSDYSWYDGNVYVDGGIVTNNKWISDTDLEEKNYYINHIIKKNDLTLKYDYFKYLK